MIKELKVERISINRIIICHRKGTSLYENHWKFNKRVNFLSWKSKDISHAFLFSCKISISCNLYTPSKFQLFQQRYILYVRKRIWIHNTILQKGYCEGYSFIFELEVALGRLATLAFEFESTYWSWKGYTRLREFDIWDWIW